MKNLYTYLKFCPVLIFLLFCLFSGKVFAQPDYEFRNPVLVAGTDLTVGASYLFSNVRAGVDARMTINYMSPGVTVTEIDGTSGYDEALQPTLHSDPFSNGYMEMHIEFLTAGTSSPMVQLEVPVTCIDVDGVADFDYNGRPLYEFDVVDLGGGYVDYQLLGGELTINQVGTAVSGKNIGAIDYPGRDTTARQVMFTVVNGHISSCVIRVGVDNQSSLGTTRLRSVYFKKFTYSTSLLAKSSLQTFRGIQKNSAIELQWRFDKQNKNLKSVIVEKAIQPAQFVPIGEVLPVAGATDYKFQDHSNDQVTSYYRLKLVNFDGSTNYSNILVFHTSQNRTGFKIFPSIVEDNATLQLNANKTTVAQVQVADSTLR